MAGDALDEAISAVRSGESSSLDLGVSLNEYTRLPLRIRPLHGLRTLRLGWQNSRMELPNWLAELPRLERIDASSSVITRMPELPNVRWTVLADTLPGVKPQLIRQAMGLNDLPEWLR